MSEAGDWSAATFEGATRAARRDIARLSPERRVEWLESALQFALETGALEAVRRQRQAAADEMWARP